VKVSKQSSGRRGGWPFKKDGKKGRPVSGKKKPGLNPLGLSKGFILRSLKMKRSSPGGGGWKEAKGKPRRLFIMNKGETRQKKQREKQNITGGSDVRG